MIRMRCNFYVRSWRYLFGAASSVSLLRQLFITGVYTTRVHPLAHRTQEEESDLSTVMYRLRLCTDR